MQREIEEDDRLLRAALIAVPGVLNLEAEGFTAIETLMGNVDLAAGWSADHVRWVRDTRYEVDPEEDVEDLTPGFQDGRLFMVRSPWPSIDLSTVIKLMFRWLGRNKSRYAYDVTQHGFKVDKAAQLAVVEEFFRQPEPWVRAFSRGRINRLQ